MKAKQIANRLTLNMSLSRYLFRYCSVIDDTTRQYIPTGQALR
jgi:hypothetical protein